MCHKLETSTSASPSACVRTGMRPTRYIVCPEHRPLTFPYPLHSPTLTNKPTPRRSPLATRRKGLGMCFSMQPQRCSDLKAVEPFDNALQLQPSIYDVHKVGGSAPASPTYPPSAATFFGHSARPSSTYPPSWDPALSPTTAAFDYAAYPSSSHLHHRPATQRLRRARTARCRKQCPGLGSSISRRRRRNRAGGRRLKSC